MAKKPQGKRSKAPSPPVDDGCRRSSKRVTNAEAPVPRVSRQPYRGRSRVAAPAPKPAVRRSPARPRRVAAPEAAPPVVEAPAAKSRPNRPGRPRHDAEPAPAAAPVEPAPEERRRSGRGRRAADPVPQPVAAQIAEPVEEPPREEEAIQAVEPVQVAPAAGNRGGRHRRVAEPIAEPVELFDDDIMIMDVVRRPAIIEIDGLAEEPRRNARMQQRRNQERAWSEESDDIEIIEFIRGPPRMMIELDQDEVPAQAAPMVVELEPINA